MLQQHTKTLLKTVSNRNFALALCDKVTAIPVSGIIFDKNPRIFPTLIL